MSLLKNLSLKINQGDLDSDGRSLQGKDSVHRVALMSVEDGKFPDGGGHFYNPIGVATFYGFGADGYFYEAGVQQRTWREGECIDDFSDFVTDVERWSPVGNDLQEGGMDQYSSPPFGKRLFALYSGPVNESYSRKGKMILDGTGGGKANLSSRVATFTGEFGVDVDNAVLLGIQSNVDDDSYVFVGFVNTIDYPFSVVQGYYDAGVLTVSASNALPVGTVEVEVSITVDYGTGGYQGLYSLSPNGSDISSPEWLSVGAVDAFPVALIDDVVPRIQVNFPNSYNSLEIHNLSDVRVEVGSDVWLGQQRASWWLETQDSGNSVYWSGVQSECPSELLIVWERTVSGLCDFSLIDVDDVEDPKLWRRWSDMGYWGNTDLGFDMYWSPGWMDAAEGHIVVSRNLSGINSQGVSGEEKGEIWVLSLRWDKVVVFTVDGLGVVVSYYDSGTGRILRESGNWGSRRWMFASNFSLTTHYDRYQTSEVVPFVGTLSNRLMEPVVPAITYGVDVRLCDDGEVYVAYGVQEVPAVLGEQGKYYAGVIKLGNQQATVDYGRWLFRKNSATYDLWDYSDEAWVVVGLAYDRSLWWLQGGENGAFHEIDGVLCRKNFVALADDNLSSVPYLEDNSWQDVNYFMGKGINLNLVERDVSGNEFVVVCSGWKGGSHLSVIWYNSGSPESSVVKTYGVPTPVESVSHEFNRRLPYKEFPRWVPYVQSSSLDDCRITGGAGDGWDSYLGVDDGFWLAYGRLLGVGSRNLRYGLLRGAPIQDGDFVLEFTGRYIPPFTNGYLFNASAGMTLNQRVSFVFGVMGERRVEGSVSLIVSGDLAGGPSLRGDFRNASITGDQISSGSLFPPSTFLSSGSYFSVRVKRVGLSWLFLFFNVEQNVWQEILAVQGLSVPVIPFMRVEVMDAIGVPCSVALELSSMILAPVDEALGVHYYRPVSYNTIPSRVGQLSGGTAFRSAVPVDAVSGSFLCADSWILPGIMPAP